MTDLDKLAKMVAAMPEPHRLARSDMSLILRRLAPALITVAKAADEMHAEGACPHCEPWIDEGHHYRHGDGCVVEALGAKLAEVFT